MIRTLAIVAGNLILIASLVVLKGGEMKLAAMAGIAVVVGSMLGFTVIQVMEEYGPPLSDKH